jgi:hypothetical protein
VTLKGCRQRILKWPPAALVPTVRDHPAAPEPPVAPEQAQGEGIPPVEQINGVNELRWNKLLGQGWRSLLDDVPDKDFATRFLSDENCNRPAPDSLRSARRRAANC